MIRDTRLSRSATPTQPPGQPRWCPAPDRTWRRLRADGKSLDMYNATMQADRSLRAGDVAVTTWMGYDRPMDLAQAASSSYANNGAGALDSYTAGVQASHDSGIPLAIDTVVGHSYGSTLVGAAGAGDHHLAADNVIAVGSPGRARVRSEPRPRWPRLCHTRTARHHSPGGRCRSGAQPHLGRVRRCRTQAAPGPALGPEILNLPSVAAHSSYWDDEIRHYSTWGRSSPVSRPRMSCRRTRGI